MTTATLLFLQSDMARLLAQTGWVARGVLLILLAFSVFSWAIIYRKHTALRRARAHSDKFLEAFRAAERLPEARPLASAFPASPLMVVYVAAMKEFESQVGPATITPRPRDFGRDIASAVAVAMQLASSSQVARLERWMSFLATTGSVTPFIGLFG
ncbi:MAG: MotA/TolQ/ExbB proton channel family protein, partial [Candidatus Acidiferrales bacterium]